MSEGLAKLFPGIEDWFIVLIPLFLIAYFIPFFIASAKQAGVSFLLRMIYEVFMTGKFGATLGKMIIGAKIVRMDGSALGYSFAFFRFLGKILSDFTCYIGYLIVAFREDKRGLHDLIARTRVIYKR